MIPCSRAARDAGTAVQRGGRRTDVRRWAARPYTAVVGSGALTPPQKNVEVPAGSDALPAGTSASRSRRKRARLYNDVADVLLTDSVAGCPALLVQEPDSLPHYGIGDLSVVLAENLQSVVDQLDGPRGDPAGPGESCHHRKRRLQARRALPAY